MPSETNALSLKNVHVSYENLVVAEDISFDVKKGEMFGLIGINGAGKTSLIKSVIGLKERQAGEIKIFDRKDLDQGSKKFFGYLPERFDPPWFLTGREFVKFTLSLYNIGFDESVLHEFCKDISLGEQFLGKRMTTYSKGMRQKLGLIATLMSDVELLILDEPMSGLDPLARVNVKTLLNKAKEKGQTVFLSSHILADLDDMCDRIAILDNKKIRFVGTPSDLKHDYNTRNLEQAFLSLLREGKRLNENGMVA